MPPPVPSAAATLEFEVDCELDEVRPARQKLHAFLVARGCSPNEAQDCELALAEACNNAIQYARPGARQMPLHIRAFCEARQIELRVTDHTPGFNWPGEVALPQAEAERGRGIYLIKALMDTSEYERLADRNVLVLRKTRKLRGV